ncbi:MAG: protein kinase [Kofleriaceae bacterium]|nr:protein kinase [Kofleriaceae bacterium]
MHCLSDNDATEFLAGALPAAGLQRVEKHLASCKDCRTLIAAVGASGDDATGRDSDVATAPRALRVPAAPKLPMDVGNDPTVAATVSLPRKNIGDRVGRYLVLGTLGIGGMGVVFTAYDPQLDRKVALKLLRAAVGAGPGNGANERTLEARLDAQHARTRLRREAQAIARLSHPHVVAVYDVGTTDDGDVYIAMEFVEGQNLSVWLRAWARPWRDIIDVFLQAGRGLAAAHDVGLLHRDFKPDNVLVGEHGRVRVGDFGLARSVLTPDDAQTHVSVVSPLHASLTATGTVLGTPRYMPPEQLTGQPIDGRSDQFSFCVALYEALFGQHPLPGNTAVSMLEQRARAAVPADGQVPPPIVRAILRGLEPDPSKRFASMQVLLAEITPDAPRRRWAPVAAALAGVLVIGGVALATVARNQRLNANGTEAMLTQRIEAIEVDRARLLNELQKSAKKQDISAAEIRQLQTKIAQKDAEISDLIKEIGTRAEIKNDNGNPRTMARAGTPRTTGPTSDGVAGPGQVGSAFTRTPERVPGFPAGTVGQTPPRPQNSSTVSSTLAAASNELRGCFREWSERYPGRSITLTVATAISPDGIAHSASTSGTDDSSLPMCVTDAVKRIHFPVSTAAVDLVISTTWVDGVLTTKAVMTRRGSATGVIDID